MRNADLVIKEIYLSEIVIECEEVNQVKPLLTLFHKAGYKWADNDSYIPICHNHLSSDRYYDVSKGKFSSFNKNVSSYTYTQLQEYINGAGDTLIELEIRQLGNKCTTPSKYDKFTDRELIIQLLERFDKFDNISEIS